ncbi:MAG TPA: ATP-binding cassette domain-containing protein [Anaerolineae bacterium]|mgnify:CR=1 FL=1|nr:ATP-binding cassette domain-containing protein [Anaerolineae bacterium]HOQ98983.1 ATP-binding cassette domain-containing protein [Anaerolineae bacterium]
MTAIHVSGLCKTFRAKRKAAGLRGSLRALVRPEWQTVEAVRGISFEMAEGEVLGLIGPNGAGKSTTIKMLTGILYPTAGEAEVLGYVPWRQRRRLAYRIGTVFGQRPQLWYHLPAIDTFYLLGKIYELDEAVVRSRVALLSKAFEIEDLLETPVRKLSLGQRMRCEVAASLLHQPRLLLLDEPSIGLDVVAKQRMRDTIRTMSQAEGVGVLLTSHDAGDIEALCQRVIIINHGQIVYQDKVSSLKRRFLTRKTVDVRYGEPVPAGLQVEGAEVLKVGRYGAKLRFDTRRTPVEAVLARLGGLGSLVDLTVSDPSLEEVIRTIYEEQQPVAPGA